MSLNNVELRNGSLYSISNDGFCESDPVIQEEGEADFESVRETRVSYLLNNISILGESEADTCVTSTPVVSGDRVFIVDEAGTVTDTTIGSVNYTDSNLIPVLTGNTAPYGTFVTSESDGYLVSDGVDSTRTSLNVDEYVGYIFNNNEPIIVNSYQMIASHSDDRYNIAKWVIEGTMDGTTWITISIEDGGRNDTGIYDIQSPGEFVGYRLRCTKRGHYAGYVNIFALIGDNGVSFDTSLVTNGSIPSKVFRFEEVVSVNNVPLVEKDIFYEYGGNGIKLLAFATYYDKSVEGREIRTKIEFSAYGNEAKEISGKIYKLI